MRTNHLVCLFAAVAATVAVSCQKDETKPTEFNVGATELTVPATPWTATVEYSIENPVQGAVVSATCDADWVHDLSVASEKTVTFSTDQNFGDERNTVVTLTYSEFVVDVKVKQMSADENIATAISSVAFKAEGGVQTVTVLSSRNWTVTGGADWVVADVAEGTPETSVTFTAEANPTIEARSTEFEFHLANSENVFKLAVVQEASKPTALIKDNNFRKYLLNNFDKDGDGEFSTVELIADGAVDYSEDTDGPVTSFAGIELFKGLTSFSFEAPIYSYSGKVQSTAETIDLSKNVALKNVKITYNQLKEANFEGLASLEELNVAFDTALHVINIKGCSAIKTFYGFSSGIRAIDFSECPNAETITVYGSKSESLDFSKNPKLTSLSAGSDSLKTIVLKGNTELVSLSFNSLKNVTALPDVSGLAKLKSFSATDYGCETFDLKDSPKLSSLSLQNCNKLKHLYVNNNTRLKSLSVMNCPVIEDITYYTGQSINEETYSALNPEEGYLKKYIDRPVPADIASVVTDANLKKYLLGVADKDGDGKITLAEAEAVTEIDFSGKSVASVDGLEWFSKLRKINASNNSIAEFEGNIYPNLRTLDVSNNKIAALDISGVSVENVYASNNQLTSFEYSGYDLCKVDLSHNKLSGSLEFKYHQYLSDLNLSDNEIGQLTLSGLYSLTDLNISNNKIDNVGYESGMYISSCSYLKNFYANNFGTTDNFKSILKGFSQLVHLEIQGCQTPVLNLSNCGKTLTYLDLTDAKTTTVYLGYGPVIEDANIKKGSSTYVYRWDEE